MGPVWGERRERAEKVEEVVALAEALTPLVSVLFTSAVIG